MSAMYRIQVRNKDTAWVNLYGLLTAAQASVYWAGQSAHNGWKARLKCGNRVVCEKGDL